MESKYIFGIDLGTTYSVISYLDENLLIQTCSNEDGDMITPSVVDLSDVNPTVGQVAKDNKVFYPHSVLDFFKREMGNGHATIYYGENFDKETTAIDLSAEVLRYLAKYASDATDSSIEMVVITVPAYFGPEEKQSTKEAAEKAGFKDVFLIEEPTAAAVYYGYKGDKNETVLVYDLGGGTFDVVAVEINGYNYNCFVVDGDYQLGGKDWDTRMQDIIKEKLTEKGVDISNLEDEDTAEIQAAAEKAKKTLTPRETTNVKLRIEGTKYEFEVTRAEFEEKTKDLLDRTIETTKSVKEKAEAKGSKITKILLVGGSSYMPQVQQRLISEFSDLEIPNPMDPNMAVSKGAAYYAKAIIGRVSESSVPTIGGENDQPSEGFVLPTGYVQEDGTVIELPSGVPTIKKVSVSSIGIRGLSNGTPMIMTLLMRGNELPTTSDLDIPLSNEAIAAGHVELSLFEHRLEEKFVSPDNDEADLKEMQKQGGEISKGLPDGAKMHIHMTIDDEGLLKLTATDPNGVAIDLEAMADAKSAD